MLIVLFSTPSHGIDAWSIQDTDKRHSITPVQNQWTLVSLWALDCIVCEQQKPALSQFNTRYPNIDIVGVSLDGRANVDLVRQRLAEKPVSFKNAITDLASFEPQYRSQFGKQYIGTPTYILYSPDRKLKGVHVGPIDLNNLIKLVNTDLGTESVVARQAPTSSKPKAGYSSMLR